MAYNQPFHESNTQNPWAQQQQQEGPRFGNAYEDNMNDTWQGGGIPAPSAYQPMESNKTEYMPSSSPSPASANPYQYTGTRLGQQDGYGSGNAYSGINSPPPSQQQQQQSTTTPTTTLDNALPPPWNDHKTTHPNKWRPLLRLIILIGAVGHLGFAAGASPRSGEPPPLTASGCFYYLYGVAAVTILYSLYHIGYYFFRRYMHGMKTSRALMMAADVVLAVMWGVGIIVEAAKYKCPPGQHNGWCDFYNVSIFFGFLCFAGLLVAAAWDLVGGCIAHKNDHNIR